MWRSSFQGGRITLCLDDSFVTFSEVLLPWKNNRPSSPIRRYNHASILNGFPKLWTSPRADSRERLNCSSPSRRSLGTPRTACACLVFLSACLFIPLRASAQDTSQDVAEAARQEKARRAAQSSSQSHVYTNEDLRRSRILTDAERAALAARKSAPVPLPPEPAIVQPAGPADAASASSAEPLGDVARRYRREKIEREAAQAQKIPMPSPFHLDIAQPALAEVAPRRGPLLSPFPLEAKSARPKTGTLSVKRDPFSRSMNAPASDPTFAPLRRAVSAVNVAPPPAMGIRNGLPPKSIVPSAAKSALVGLDGRVTIRRGDSLWNLSRKYFGSGIRWHDWLVSNSDLGDPRRIRPGMQLVVPQAYVQSRGIPPATLVVQPGDSLWKLAASQYGKGSAWRCLARANPTLRDPAILFPGQHMILPATCAAPLRPRSAAIVH
jgi:nucleoid-associated protein YgaU